MAACHITYSNPPARPGNRGSTATGGLHREVDLVSQLLLRGRHSLSQPRQEATCFVTTDLAQRAGKANQIVLAEATALHQLTEARHSARITDAAEDVDGGGPRMVIVEQRQEPLQRHVGIPLAERAGHLDEERVPVVEAGVLQLFRWRRRRHHFEQRLEQLDATFVNPAVLSFQALVKARLRPKGRRQGIERLDDLVSGDRHF
jgi:hypothetical protein